MLGNLRKFWLNIKKMLKKLKEFVEGNLMEFWRNFWEWFEDFMLRKYLDWSGNPLKELSENSRRI